MSTTHPVLRLPSGCGSYCMPISPPILLPLVSRKSARVTQSFFSVASWIHHAYLLIPLPDYPVSLSHTSNNGRSSIHYATIPFCRSMEVLGDCVPAVSCTPSAPRVSHVPSPNRLAHIPLISLSDLACVPSTLFTITVQYCVSSCFFCDLVLVNSFLFR